MKRFNAKTRFGPLHLHPCPYPPEVCDDDEPPPLCEDCPVYDKRPAIQDGLCKKHLRAAMAEDYKDGEA